MPDVELFRRWLEGVAVGRLITDKRVRILPDDRTGPSAGRRTQPDCKGIGGCLSRRLAERPS
jgi:hypothetical protein